MPRGQNFELRISRLQLDFKCSTGLLRIKVVSPACSCASRIPYTSRASIIAVRTDVTDGHTGDMTTVLTEFSTCFYFGVRRLPKFRNMEWKKVYSHVLSIEIFNMSLLHAGKNAIIL